MAYNLYRLSIFFDNRQWRTRAEQMLRHLAGVIIKYPASFGFWLSVFFEMIEGTKEIAVLGTDWKYYLEKILGVYISHKLVQSSAKPLAAYPLLANKPENSEIRIYVCENYACHQPVSTIQDFVGLLHGK